MIHRLNTPIAEDETGGELALRLSELGALALIEALSLIDMGGAVEVPQDPSEATYAPRITRDMARIRWDSTAQEVSRMIRAYDPRPAS
jgi:methionyl-tRNA formyltransferase